MFEIVLFEPEIPPNTGNIIRLCANTAARLHLVGPCGFTLDEPQLRRAGLDYHDIATVRLYQDWSEFRRLHPLLPLWAFSTRGKARYDRASFNLGDGMLFGPESRGLPLSLLDSLEPERVLRLPMQAQSRSLNLSNTVAIALYEALRQHAFEGLA